MSDRSKSAPRLRSAELEQLLRRRARASFADFIDQVEVPGAPVEPTDPSCEQFYPTRVKPAAHHRLLIRVLQALADGNIPSRRAMFFLPPGSAKSTYASVAFPPWYLGRAQKRSILSCSFEQGLARSFGRRCRALVKSEDYQSIFGCGLTPDSSAADEWEMDGERGYLARGIRAGITGRRCDGGIIDDPVRNRADADSEAISEHTWAEYNSSFLTRLKPDAWQLILQTRWAMGDLSGRLLPEGYDGRTGFVHCTDGYDWYVVNLPILCERDDDPIGRKPGDLLWPEWYKLDAILKIRDNPARARDWASLYQQRPSLDGGLYFKDDWFKYFEPDSPPLYLRIYGASDYAVTDKGGDYSVHVVVGVDPKGVIYILDIWWEQVTTDVSTDAFLDMARDHGPLVWATDKDQITKSIGPFVRRRMRERNTYVAMEEFTLGREDKQMRCRSFQARMAQGMVYWPKFAPWLERARRELLQFPAGKHDDLVDALGLIGRLLDTIIDASVPEDESPNHQDDYVNPGGGVPDTKEWTYA